MTVVGYAMLLVRGVGNNRVLSVGDRTARCSKWEVDDGEKGSSERQRRSWK